MAISIQLNNEKYRYDIFQIFNLFYPFEEITFNKFLENFNKEIKINVYEDKVNINGYEKDIWENFNNKYNKKLNVKRIIYKFLSEECNTSFSWGVLTGIRPSKIATSLLNKYSYDEIINFYEDAYFVSREKAKLSLDVAIRESGILTKDDNLVSVYISMAFCPTRCSYCSFISTDIRGKEHLVPLYVDALIKEINAISNYIKNKNYKIHTVYFGGGTPTSINEEYFEKTLKCIYENLLKDNNVREYTIECGRVDSINDNKLKLMRNYGATRISINPQTMNDNTLKRIGRSHTSGEVINIFNSARKFGFNNINMDLIVGLSGESIEDVKNTCKEIEKLNPESITLHELSIKRASKIHEDIVNNKENYYENYKLNSEMQNEVFNTCTNLGLTPYYMYRQKNMVGNNENIGFSKPGYEGIYNIEMMEENQIIFGIGTNSSTKLIVRDENRIERYLNLKDVNEYIKRIDDEIIKKINYFDMIL